MEKKGVNCCADAHANILLFAGYMGLLLLGHVFHEPWRDEYLSYAVIEHSASIFDIYHRLRYENHPGLWYVELWVIDKLFHLGPATFHVATLINSALGAYLLFFRSPFSLKEKLLIAASYFVLYEYTVISRSYSLLLPLVFAWCIAACRYAQRQARRDVVCLLAIGMLMANISLYSVVCLVPLTMMAALEKPIRLRAVVLAAGMALVVGAVCLSIYPPKEFVHYVTPTNNPQWMRFVSAAFDIGVIYFPIVDITNPNWLMPAGWAMGGGLLWVIGIVTFRRFFSDKKALITYAVGLMISFVLALVTQVASTRQAGHLWVLLLAILWIRYVPLMVNDPKTRKFIHILLGMNALCGVAIYYSDMRYPFSDADNAIRAIYQRSGDNYIFGAYPDYIGSAYVVKSRQPMPQLTSGRFYDMVIWDAERLERYNRMKKDKESYIAEQIPLLTAEARQRCSDAYVISDSPLELEKLHFPLQGIYETAVRPLVNETAYVYKIPVVFPGSCKK